MRTLVIRFLSLFRRGRLDQELHKELAAHLAMQEEEFRNQGLSPTEARARALREFGGVSQTVDLYREQRGVPTLESAFRDVRFAARGLIHNPGFAIAAILSLALGIGANTAIFSMFHALMLRTLPVSHPEQLVTLYRTGGWGAGFSSYPLYKTFSSRTDLFAGVAADGNVVEARFRYGRQANAETVRYSLVSGNYFSVFGVAPVFGRLFSDEDNRVPHSQPVAVLSYDFWLKRFGGDSGILGRTINVDNDPLTVIGVAAPGFYGVNLDHRPDLWEPAMMRHGDVMDVGSNWLWIVARRRPEVAPAQVQVAIDVLFRQYLSEHYGNNGNAGFRKMALDQHIEVRDGGIGISFLRETFGKPLTVLLAAVGLVLLAACVNIANLALARGTSRRKEFAVRLSIGATRGRLLRLSLMESLLIGLAGSVIGIAIAYWGEHGLMLFLPAAEGNPFAGATQTPVLLSTLVLGLFSVALFGILPAWRSTSVNAGEAIKSGAGPATPRHGRFRSALVIAQVAFSVVLIAMAALFGRSLSALRSIDLGFRNVNLISVPIDFPSTWTMDRKDAARQEIMGRAAAIPGVRRAVFGSPGPYLGGFANHTVRVPGAEGSVLVSVQMISQRFFETLGARIVAGREFDDHDGAASQKVVAVNTTFLRRYFSGESNPLSRTIDFERTKDDIRRIVGVVADIPHQGLRTQAEPTVYVPVAQDRASFGEILLDTARSVGELSPIIRHEITRLGPDVTSNDLSTIRTRIDDSIFQDRLVAAVSGFFGMLALVLATVGLYGVLAYSTARRTREIGIRIAMGAARRRVLLSVIGNALLLVAGGFAVGLPVSLFASRSITTLLYNVPPYDWIAFSTAIAALTIAGMAAAFGPALRASRTEPARVLREE